MALTFDLDRLDYDDRQEILRFYANDGATPVPCAVSREALVDLVCGVAATAEDLMAIYRSREARIHAIVARKYQHGHVGPDGLIMVLAGDVN